MDVTSERYEAVIVGGGPAGLSAALALGRACRRVALFDDGKPRNGPARSMHGYLSRDGIAPSTFLAIARRQLRRYPNVQVREGRIERAERGVGGFTLTAQDGERIVTGRVLLANGIKDVLPAIENIMDFWGKSAFVCPFCDGWEIRRKKTIVYGDAVRALDLAQELMAWTKNIMICATGAGELGERQRRWLAAAKVRLEEARIEKLLGGAGRLHEVVLSSGRRMRCRALFLTTPERQACDLSRQLGCKRRDSGALEVDELGRTSVPGCYGAGDAITTLHQVGEAAASGVRSAVAIVRDLTDEAACTLCD